MALIGKIRKNGWLLTIMLALGLAGFMMMDMFSGEKSVFGSGRTTLGEIEGQAIDQREFERAYSALYAGGTGDVYQQRAGLWNFMVEDELIRAEARELGLGVPQEELDDLQYGTSLSPIITQRFQDPDTRQVNREALTSYREAEASGQLSQNPQLFNFWNYQKREINKERLQSKLGALVSKAMYTPDWMAEKFGNDQATRVDFAYVSVPYESIPDDAVELTDADFEAHMQENAALYRQTEPARVISYIAFDVAPTVADSAAIQQALQELKAEWQSRSSDTAFVEQNRGTFPGAYVSTEELPEAVQGAPVDTIIGPYLEGDRYVITKVIDRMVVPDSVESRHILLKADTPEEYARALQLADSLEQVLEAGETDFATLAQQFSIGPTGPNGGDLGTVAPGAMVGPFNDLIFYQAEPGEVNQVQTQFGLHLVEVTDQVFVDQTEGTRIASISRAVEPSEETQRRHYEEATTFIQENRDLESFRQAAEGDDRTFAQDQLIRRNDFSLGELGAGQPVRDMSRWAFNNDPGEVSPEIYAFKDEVGLFDATYVVMAVTGELEEGTPDWRQARSLIEGAVRNEKKAQMVSTEGNLLSIQAQYPDATLDTIRTLNFGSAFIPGLGAETEVIGEAFRLPQNSTSEPIAGNTAIYVLRILQRTEPNNFTPDVEAMRNQQQSRLRSQVPQQIAAALRRTADIEDNRARFY